MNLSRILVEPSAYGCWSLTLMTRFMQTLTKTSMVMKYLRRLTARANHHHLTLETKQDPFACLMASKKPMKIATKEKRKLGLLTW